MEDLERGPPLFCIHTIDMNNLTTNLNFLSPVGWKLTIDNLKYANIAYFSTKVILPAVTVAPAKATYRNMPGFVPGDFVEYAPLAIDFMIDEDMKNYKEALNWLSLSTAQSRPLMHDLHLAVMTGKNNLNNQVRFIRAFPTSITPIEFTAQATDIKYATATVTFQYDRYEFME